MNIARAEAELPEVEHAETRRPGFSCLRTPAMSKYATTNQGRPGWGGLGPARPARSARPAQAGCRGRDKAHRQPEHSRPDRLASRTLPKVAPQTVGARVRQSLTQSAPDGTAGLWPGRRNGPQPNRETRPLNPRPAKQRRAARPGGRSNIRARGDLPE